RFAGPGASYADNVAKLLAALENADDRRARFRTVALARFRDGTELVAEGWVDGTITDAPRGANGFGYDPVFVPGPAGVPAEWAGRTFAEMPAATKHALSHRGVAFRALARLLAGEAG
ncbi:MAG: non-canonical purine NTP pyrophosphatase, partial [Acidimicrobiales bacterium]